MEATAWVLLCQRQNKLNYNLINKINEKIVRFLFLMQFNLSLR